MVNTIMVNHGQSWSIMVNTIMVKNMVKNRSKAMLMMRGGEQNQEEESLFNTVNNTAQLGFNQCP
jgi:hypothetical protein